MDIGPRFGQSRQIPRWGLAVAAGGLLTTLAIARTTAAPFTPGRAGAAPSRPAAAAVVTVGDLAVELRSGETVLAHIGLRTPLPRRGSPILREVEVEGHRIAELRIPIRGGRSAEEIWIGELGDKTPLVIWSGLVGPRDIDDETQIAVDVTPDGILEYQTAAQISRCDGEPVQLFPSAWDFNLGRFRPVRSRPPPVAPWKVTARRGDPAMPTGHPISGFHFTAASTTAGAGNDARNLTAPTALDDGDPRTAWAEGLGGDGRGEFLTARASVGQYLIRGLRILPGDASSPGAFKASNRIKSLTVALGSDPQHHFEVEFPEDPAAAPERYRAPYWIPLPTPTASTCVTVVIREIYRGSHSGAADDGGTTAISDLMVFTELDEPSGVDRLVTDMASGADCSSRVLLLQSIGAAAVLPAVRAIGTASGMGRECLIESVSRLDATARSEPALQALAGALVGASSTEERLIATTMARAQRAGTPAPVGKLAALLSGPSTRSTLSSTPSPSSMSTPSSTSSPPAPTVTAADRARAARLLGSLVDLGATEALLAAAGTGSAETRLAIVEALAHSPGARLPAVVAAIDAGHARKDEESTRREADLIRILPALARAGESTDRITALQSVLRALASSPSFEVRARSIGALGELGGEPAVAGLSEIRVRSDDAVLRFLSVRELTHLASAPADPTGPDLQGSPNTDAMAARAALRAGLRDADPRVRETAAQSLGALTDVVSEPLLIAAAKDEPWPFARRAQIEALSRSCGPPARDLLVRALERDVDEVRRASLIGLVRCRDRRARGALLQTLKNRRATAPLRELAATLLGELGDRQASGQLAEMVPGLVNEAEGDLAIEGVTVMALRSLAHLGGSEAARVAADLAVDAGHPYRKVAIESLGEICDPVLGARALSAAARAGTDRLAADAREAAQRCSARDGGLPARH